MHCVLTLKWGDNDHHYMACKVCKSFVPLCYESIMDHVGGSWQFEKLHIAWFESVVPNTCKSFCFQCLWCWQTIVSLFFTTCKNDTLVTSHMYDLAFGLLFWLKDKRLTITC